MNNMIVRRTSSNVSPVWGIPARRYLRTCAPLFGLDHYYRFLLPLVLNVPDAVLRVNEGERVST